jgi:SAM-dependent methyltransferase
MESGESGPAVHRAALEGFSREALSYGRGRPDYPQQLSIWLQHALRLCPGKSALDLGAGTGKFTRLLLQTGAAIVAIEPVDAMRAQLLENLPGIVALAATAQSMPVAQGSVDAVVCAQAFHWFATVPAVREIGRVLRSGGRPGLVWNVRDESVDWVAAITRIMAPYEGDTPRFHTGEWRRLFPNELFSQLEETNVAHQHVGSAQAVILDRAAGRRARARGRPAEVTDRQPPAAAGPGYDRFAVSDARLRQHPCVALGPVNTTAVVLR